MLSARMGAEHQYLRPGYPLDMEVEEAEEVLAPSDDEQDEHGDDDQGENEKEDKKGEEDGADDVKQCDENDEDESQNVNDREDEASASENERDEESAGGDVWEPKKEFHHHRPILHFYVPLLVPGRPATPAPCAPYDFTVPMFDGFWDEPSCAQAEMSPLSPNAGTDGFDEDNWALSKYLEPSSPCFAWPSQVILPQVMIWN